MSDLRKLAEAATPGPWFHGKGDRHYSEDETFLMICEDARREVPIIFVYAGDLDEGEIDKQFATRADFIAACDPQTILALLDDLDLAKTQRALDDIRIEKAHAAVQRAESERDRYRAALDEIAAIPGYTGVTEHARGIAMDALGES
jgi:hypothetical protein